MHPPGILKYVKNQSQKESITKPITNQSQNQSQKVCSKCLRKRANH